MSGPFRMDVLNTADYGGFCLNDFGKMGFDAGDAMDLNDQLPGESKELLSRPWKDLGTGNRYPSPGHSSYHTRV